MIDITDKSYKPNIDEISDFIGNPLFLELCAHMDAEYKAFRDVAYSGDNVLPGWNIRFYKAGKTLCRLYPERGGFSVLLVVGRKEKDRAEALLPLFSDEVRDIYLNTREGMGQRWLIINLKAHNAAYEDLLALIKLRKA